MTCFAALRRAVVLIPLLFFLTGCWPDAGRNMDEQKEAYYEKGKSLVKAMDSEGAIEAFEKALEVNPRSASAHFELGVLYMQRMNDAAAIYHFEKHLKLRPDSPLADIVKSRITACKLDLARAVAMYLRPPQVQKEFDRLTSENRGLKDQLEVLQKQLKESESNRLAAVSAAAALAAAPKFATNPLAAASDPLPVREKKIESTRPALIQAGVKKFAGAPGNYLVKKGDTFYGIARRHGILASDLRAANPGMNPDRLRANQVLKIPSRRGA